MLIKFTIIIVLALVLILACADIEDNSQRSESERFPNSVLEKASITLTTEGRKEA